jgi:hypothetical protein|tara:strand:- start:1561 stop:2163 length:603 start_codon:yes stop_codon:yes gene_type:complete
MKLVDTETPDPDRFARTADGKIDFDAYKGLNATYRTGDLDFEVTIVDSRQRFGHLDLLVEPKSGAGDRWVEFKNLTIHNDPAQMAAATAIAMARTVPTSIPSPYVEHDVEEISPGIELVHPHMEKVEEEVAEVVTVPPTPAPAAISPSVSANYGTHWTESTNPITPAPAEVSTEVVEDSTTSDMEVLVENILSEDSPVIK